MKKLYKALLIASATLPILLIATLLLLFQPDIPVEQLKARYTNEASRFMNLKGMQVHYRDEGPPGDTVPLVLLHGTSAFLQTWDACTTEWVKDHRVIRMDLPAFGLTGPAPDGDYSIEAYVDFLHSFLQNLQVTRCYLAGNSLGGFVAWSYAAKYPDEVQKLVLVDAAGYPIEHAKGNLAFKLGRIPVLRDLLKVITPKKLVRKSIEDVYGNKALVTDSLVTVYRDMACREGNRNALVIRLNKPQSGDTTLVKTLHLPTLVIWGDRDFLIPPANAYKFARDLPNDTLVVLKGIGHVPMEENPASIIPLIKSFLQ